MLPAADHEERRNCSRTTDDFNSSGVKSISMMSIMSQPERHGRNRSHRHIFHAPPEPRAFLLFFGRFARSTLWGSRRPRGPDVKPEKRRGKVTWTPGLSPQAGRGDPLNRGWTTLVYLTCTGFLGIPLNMQVSPDRRSLKRLYSRLR